MEELVKPVEFSAEQLLPHEEVLRQDGETLLLGWVCRNLDPDDGEILVHGDPTYKAEVNPLQVQDHDGGDARV